MGSAQTRALEVRYRSSGDRNSRIKPPHARNVEETNEQRYIWACQKASKTPGLIPHPKSAGSNSCRFSWGHPKRDNMLGRPENVHVHLMNQYHTSILYELCKSNLMPFPIFSTLTSLIFYCDLSTHSSPMIANKNMLHLSSSWREFQKLALARMDTMDIAFLGRGRSGISCNTQEEISPLIFEVHRSSIQNKAFMQK